MDDLSFFVEKDGKTIKCDIISMIPGENDNETYIAFTDYIEENNEPSIKYAKIIKKDNNYSIEDFNDELILEQLQNKMNEDIMNFIKENMENSYE
jgi:hypothetical protein